MASSIKPRLLSVAELRLCGRVHLATVLEKLADCVNADPAAINASDDWYMKYEWTPEEQVEFEEWMAAYLKNDREAFYEFVSRSRRFTLKNAKEAAHEFTLWFGWKTKLRHY